MIAGKKNNAYEKGNLIIKILLYYRKSYLESLLHMFHLLHISFPFFI